MKENINFIDLLSIFSLFLCLFYAFQNWTLKQNKTQANKYFTYYLLNLSLVNLFFFLIRMELNDFAKFLIPVLTTSSLLMAPLIWVYQKKLMTYYNPKNNSWHFKLPLLYGGIMLLDLIFVLTTKGNFRDLSVWLFYILTIGGITALFLLSNIYYTFLSIKTLLRHRKMVSQYFSYTEKVNLNWITILLGGYIFLIAGLIISNVLDGDLSDIVFYGVLIIYVVYTGHNALKQKEINLDNKLNISLKMDENPLAELNQYSDSQQQFFAELKIKLQVIMSEKKPYLDQELTILKLAKELNTNTKYLSHIINKEFNQNFINYINEFRIKEVKEKLINSSYQNFTIEALA